MESNPEQSNFASSAAPNGDVHILVAEDTPAILRQIGRLLTHNGYRVTLTKDGEEAIRAFDEHGQDIALLILDVMLPKHTGEEVLDAIRECAPDIAVLFTTGFGETALSESTLSNPAIQIVPKPWKSAALLAAVQNALTTK